MLKSGARLKSTVSSVEVIVIQAADESVAVTCGGAPMMEMDQVAAGPDIKPPLEGQALLGKRYVDEAAGLELLCTKGGRGQLACEGRVLAVKQTKPLPSSD